MDRGRTTPPRVVLLVSSRRIPTSCVEPLEKGFPGGRRAQLVAVSTAYEAAAELLAAPADVLVVDLRLLKPAHMPLLDIARKRGAVLLGTGPMPWGTSSEQLAGMRLVARGQLASAILAATDGQAKAQSTQVAKPSQPGETAQPAQAGAYESQRPAAEGGEGPLLTAEELSALLGDVE